MRRILIVCIPLFFGCGTLAKNKLFTKHEVQESSNQLRIETSAAEKTMTFKDSTNAQVEFTILPKGNFKYSPISGFEGEAFSLTFKGQQQKFQQTKEVLAIEQKASTQTNLKQKQIMKNIDKKPAQRLTGNGIWYFLCFIVLLVALTWLFRRLANMLRSGNG